MKNYGNIVNFRATKEQEKKIDKIKKYQNLSEFLRNNIDIILDTEILEIMEKEKMQKVFSS